MADYTKMSPGELVHELGADGKKYADAFLQFSPNCGIDHSNLLGWFCTAIMAGHDHAHGNPPQNGDHAEWLLEREQAGRDMARDAMGEIDG